MIKQVLILICLVVPVIGIAQTDNNANWQLSYYGDFSSKAGLKIGYEKPIHNWIKTKSKNSLTRQKFKSLNIGLDFIYYNQTQNHKGIVLSPNISYQRTKENGKYFHMKLNLGIHKSIVNGKTYTFDDNEAVPTEKKVGQITLFNELSFGFGRDLRVSKRIPLRYFWELGLNGRYPYNSSYLPSIRIGLGIHYFLNK